jgi:hypothetical protein
VHQSVESGTTAIELVTRWQGGRGGGSSHGGRGIHELAMHQSVESGTTAIELAVHQSVKPSTFASFGGLVVICAPHVVGLHKERRTVDCTV